MCRLTAYIGTPIVAADLVTRPNHSIITQVREFSISGSTRVWRPHVCMGVDPEVTGKGTTHTWVRFSDA